jgi:carbamoylphosphate synthase small subunit
VREGPLFSVQYHPKGTRPTGSAYLFDRFFDHMAAAKEENAHA